MGDLDLILMRLSRVARSGRPLALVFDYDGTLAPIRPTPAEAELPAGVRRALGRLAASPQCAVGVVSGRTPVGQVGPLAILLAVILQDISGLVPVGA